MPRGTGAARLSNDAVDLRESLLHAPEAIEQLSLFQSLGFIQGTAQMLFLPPTFLFVYFPLTLLLVFSITNPVAGFLAIPYFFGLMTIVSIFLRKRLGKMASWFVIGWLISLGINLLMVSGTNPAIVDSAAIAAKIIFAYGIIHPRHEYATYVRTRFPYPLAVGTENYVRQP